MLTLVLAFMSLALLLFVVARQRAELIRLRTERRLAKVPTGTWKAFHRPADLTDPRWFPGR